MAVCRFWRNTIFNTPHLWTSLSLTSPNHLKLIPQAKYWLSRLGPDQYLQTLSINVDSTCPPSVIHNLLMILINKSSMLKAGLQSFTFHTVGTFRPVWETQRMCRDVLAFVHLNGINLANLELRFPGFLMCPSPIQAFLSKFPRLTRLKLHGERGQSLVFNQSQDFFRNSFSSSQTVHHDKFQSTSLAQSFPVTFVCTDPNLHSAGSKLETLSMQCASFAPSSDADGALNLGSLNFCSLENLELCRGLASRAEWDPVWQSYQQLPRLKRLRLKGLPHLINHFLDLANVPGDWSPQSYAGQPYRVDIGSILPQIECICLSTLDSPMCYKFLAVFGYQFLKLDSLSVVGLSLDSTTEPLLISAFQHLPALVHLNLSKTHATSEVIGAIKPDRLIHLQLADCPCVAFRPLASLITHRFTYLDIMGCQLISTREMIEWLAQRVDFLIWKDSQTVNNTAAKRLFLD